MCEVKTCANCIYGRKAGMACAQGGIVVPIVETIVDCFFHQFKK